MALGVLKREAGALSPTFSAREAAPEFISSLVARRMGRESRLGHRGGLPASKSAEFECIETIL